MEMSKENVLEIAKAYCGTICTIEDAENAFRFVLDIIGAESKAIETKCPYATNALNRLYIAETEINDLANDAVNALYEVNY